MPLPGSYDGHESGPRGRVADERIDAPHCWQKRASARFTVPQTEHGAAFISLTGGHLSVVRNEPGFLFARLAYILVHLVLRLCRLATGWAKLGSYRKRRPTLPTDLIGIRSRLRNVGSFFWQGDVGAALGAKAHVRCQGNATMGAGRTLLAS